MKKLRNEEWIQNIALILIFIILALLANMFFAEKAGAQSFNRVQITYECNGSYYTLPNSLVTTIETDTGNYMNHRTNYRGIFNMTTTGKHYIMITVAGITYNSYVWIRRGFTSIQLTGLCS